MGRQVLAVILKQSWATNIVNIPFFIFSDKIVQKYL